LGLQVPAAGVAAFIYDGVFIGLTATKGMSWSSLVATGGVFWLGSLPHPGVSGQSRAMAVVHTSIFVSREECSIVSSENKL
jgi:hypothetical protein